jgi:hypothetical protein
MERQTRIFPLIFDMDLKAPWCRAHDMPMIRDGFTFLLSPNPGKSGKQAKRQLNMGNRLGT